MIREHGALQRRCALLNPHNGRPRQLRAHTGQSGEAR
jgi:hypothetical protein